jgi:hypothetical protein
MKGGSHWKGDPPTDQQRSYLRVLCEQTGTPHVEPRTKGQAHAEIARLEGLTGKGQQRKAASRPPTRKQLGLINRLAHQRDVRPRTPKTLEEADQLIKGLKQWGQEPPTPYRETRLGSRTQRGARPPAQNNPRPIA